MRTLRRRREFLACAKGAKAVRPGLVLQARARADDDPMIGVGFTATKKIGGAVARNRAKRRLRALARALAPVYGRPGTDYVFVARAQTGVRPWAALLDDAKSALISLHDDARAR